MTLYDSFALALFIILFFGYHYTYLFISYSLKKETRERKIDQYRKRWLELIIERNDPTFAIQSLRNMIMTNTYLISLATILMGGMVSILFANKNLLNALDALEQVDIPGYLYYLAGHPVAIKILLGLAILLLAIYNFTISLRILNNLNFTAPTVIKLPGALEFQTEQIRRQAKHFFTGIRSLYYFFGPMLWIFDTTAMVVFTVITTIAFLRFDFIPRVKIKINENEN
jgi:uncharacterized membrane protein